MAKQNCLPYLQLSVLLLLDRQGPLCGYGITRRLREIGGRVEEAAIYTILARLREKGLVEGIAIDREGRKVIRYKLTEKGAKELKALLEQYERIKRLLDTIVQAPRTSLISR